MTHPSPLFLAGKSPVAARRCGNSEACAGLFDPLAGGMPAIPLPKAGMDRGRWLRFGVVITGGGCRPRSWQGCSADLHVAPLSGIAVFSGAHHGSAAGLQFNGWRGPSGGDPIHQAALRCHSRHSPSVSSFATGRHSSAEVVGLSMEAADGEQAGSSLPESLNFSA